MRDYTPVLRPVSFTQNDCDIPIGSSSALTDAGVHLPLAEAADLIAAQLFQGRIDLNGHSLSGFKAIRISLPVSCARYRSWSVSLSRPQTPINLYLLKDRTSFKAFIWEHLVRSVRIMQKISCTSGPVLQYTASTGQLSNHQRLALDRLAATCCEAAA